MTVNSYLTNLAGNAIIRDKEKESIQRSINALKTKLNLYMGAEISEQFIFGSYSRGTILPRNMDARSDIDYMIEFSDTSFRPQTYLDKLRRFVQANYPSSDIKQSHPTIVLSLNHINFELVPAIKYWLYGLQIPASASDYQDWQDTDPHGFNSKLTDANKTYGNQIKPLVRIMKYWNAKNRYPFESYELEQDVVNTGYGFYGLFGPQQLKDLFFDYVDGMSVSIFAPQWKKDAISRAKDLASTAKALDSRGAIIEAENTIRRLIPPVATGLLGRVV